MLNYSLKQVDFYSKEVKMYFHILRKNRTQWLLGNSAKYNMIIVVQSPPTGPPTIEIMLTGECRTNKYL